MERFEKVGLNAQLATFQLGRGRLRTIARRAVTSRGERFDLAVWNNEYPAEPAYPIDFSPLYSSVWISQ